MKFTVLAPKIVNIPDERIPQLIQRALERFYDPENIPEHWELGTYDIITQAQLDGEIGGLTEGWSIDESDNEMWGPTDIAELEKPRKPRKLKR